MVALPFEVLRGLPAGYTLPATYRLRMRQLASTATTKSACIAIRDAITAIAAGLGAWLIQQSSLSFPIDIIVVAVLILVVVRCQRGLENLTHEGSHYNVSRDHRWNDRLTDCLAALPTFQRVLSFRETHVSKHHELFGTMEDPDRRRYATFDADGIDRSSLWRYAWCITTRLPRYVGGWWYGIGTNPRTIILSVLWHLTFYIAPAAAIVGIRGAFTAWFFFWLLPFVLLLPPVRLIAEAEEHVYRNARTIFDATVSNLGWAHRFFFHPNGDAYHLVHHLWPFVPHHQVRRVHEELSAIDPIYAASRVRTAVLQEPNAPGERRRNHE